MEFEIKLFSLLEPVQQQSVAQWVSDFTNGLLGELPQMLPVSVEDIYAKYIGFAAFYNDDPIGYIGATDPVPWRYAEMSEVGSLVVDRQYRGHGTGGKLIKRISTELTIKEKLPYAFTNPKSHPIFKLSAYAAACFLEIPDLAFDACSECPSKKNLAANEICCDVLMIYKGEQL